MIDVEMRAQHRVDRLARIAGGGEIGQERSLQVVPGRDAPVLLVVAEAGVDDDAPVRRLDHQRVDAHLEAAALVGEMRLQPGDRQRSPRGVACGRMKRLPPVDLQLDDLGDRTSPICHLSM